MRAYAYCAVVRFVIEMMVDMSSRRPDIKGRDFSYFESPKPQEILVSPKRDMILPTSMPRHRQPRTVPHHLTGILLTNGSPLPQRQREWRRQEILDGQTGCRNFSRRRGRRPLWEGRMCGFERTNTRKTPPEVSDDVLTIGLILSYVK